MSESPKIIGGVKFTTSDKVTLLSEAGFGDVYDIFIKDKIRSQGGTIRYTINVRREFVPGDYVLNIVEVEPAYYVAIVCHVDVDPMKIHNLLKRSNSGLKFDAPNYLNRYDWMHFRNWGICEDPSDEGCDKFPFFNVLLKEMCGETRLLCKPQEDTSSDEDNDTDCSLDEAEESIYDDLTKEGRVFVDLIQKLQNFVMFVDGTEIENIKEGKFTIKANNEWISTMYKEDGEQKRPIGFVIKSGSDFIKGDWHYGCVLVDQRNKKCFAFVFADYYTVKILTSSAEESEKIEVDIDAADYTYPMQDFKK